MGLADHLRLLVAYNGWANGKIESAASGLSEVELSTSLCESYPTLGRTIVHTAGAQAGWLSRVDGYPIDREELLKQVQADPWAVLNRSQSGWESYAETLDDEAAASSIEVVGGDGLKRSMRVDKLVSHVMNHGSHHRAEIALMLTHLGRSPGDLDLVFFDTPQDA